MGTEDGGAQGASPRLVPGVPRLRAEPRRAPDGLHTLADELFCTTVPCSLGVLRPSRSPQVAICQPPPPVARSQPSLRKSPPRPLSRCPSGKGRTVMSADFLPKNGRRLAGSSPSPRLPAGPARCLTAEAAAQASRCCSVLAIKCDSWVPRGAARGFIYESGFGELGGEPRVRAHPLPRFPPEPRLRRKG